jgi:hypothetical protein
MLSEVFLALYFLWALVGLYDFGWVLAGSEIATAGDLTFV